MTETHHQLLTYADVVQLLKSSKTTLRRWIKQGTFPAPVKIGAGRAVRWRSADVQAYLAGLPTTA